MKNVVLVAMAVLLWSTLAAGAIAAPDTVTISAETTFQVRVQNAQDVPVNARLELAGPLEYRVSPDVAPISMFEEALFTVTLPYPEGRENTAISETLYAYLEDVTEQKTIDFAIQKRAAQGAGAEPAGGDNADGTATSLAGLGGFSLLDGALVVIVIVLAIALFTRVRHRMQGNGQGK